MWCVAVNPTSGRGKGALFGSRVAGFLRQGSFDYTLVTANNATTLRSNLRSVPDTHKDIEGVISVGGDGLAHVVLQECAPRNLPTRIS